MNLPILHPPVVNHSTLHLASMSILHLAGTSVNITQLVVFLINDDTVIKINRSSLANSKFRTCYNINDDTYIRTNTKHFGELFLCVVDAINRYSFQLIDVSQSFQIYTDTYRNGVVCFNPASIKGGCPKVSQFIPFEVHQSTVSPNFFLKLKTSLLKVLSGL